MQILKLMPAITQALLSGNKNSFIKLLPQLAGMLSDENVNDLFASLLEFLKQKQAEHGSGQHLRFAAFMTDNDTDIKLGSYVYDEGGNGGLVHELSLLNITAADIQQFINEFVQKQKAVK